MLAALAVWSGLSETRRLLRGEPFPAARLAVLSQTGPFMGARYGVPPAKLVDWAARAQSLEGAAFFAWDRDHPIAHAGQRFFALLETRPVLGTLSPPADGIPSAVLSYDCWQRKFHADDALLGHTILAGVTPARVIGVLPRDFWFLDARPEIWILAPQHGKALTWALARLKPGVTLANARAELRSLAARMPPASSGSAVTLEPIQSVPARPLATLGIPWLVMVCGTIAVAMLRFRRSPRYGAFLAAKVVLSLTLVLLAIVEYGSSWMTIHSGQTNLAAGAASLWLFLAGPPAALYWCWRDQRNRCRSCLHRLVMPVSFGEGARTLLERAGTELVCPRGHGTLFTTDGTDPSQQWDPLHGSWRELFVGK
jgi:hypothetical protein